MRIIHTADLHLGKSLDGFSRFDEQRQFLDFFIQKSADLKPDLIIIAGDIYDTANPPALAEVYFYDFLKRLSDATGSLTVIIPGNHDNPKRLSCIKPLARQHGILIYENHDDEFDLGFYNHARILSSGKGVVKADINGQVANIMALPYISEQRLNQSIADLSLSDEDSALNFEQKIDCIIKDKLPLLSEDEYNIMIAHLFTLSAKIDEQKTGYSLGGAYILNSSILPSNSMDYIALGHVHKYQKVGDADSKAYYSGSPIHYNKTETKTEQKVFLSVDIDRQKNIKVEQIPIPVYKKIEILDVYSVEDAIKLSKEKQHEQSYVYMNVHTDAPLSHSEIRQIKQYKKDIVEIRPILSVRTVLSENKNMLEQSEDQKFIEFYKDRYGKEPDKNIVDRYIDILLK